ncbi:uncharacterized protein LOC127082442 [Lathyrus oleraceus]|uniref:uncharacterized protein LOC127082442 n=1 Tax=Pisum sativum TaxID=3888 RepID=UPI0021D2F25C|nr:uncharacterized protein LOC127082442 [Pisum sativum]
MDVEAPKASKGAPLEDKPSPPRKKKRKKKKKSKKESPIVALTIDSPANKIDLNQTDNEEEEDNVLKEMISEANKDNAEINAGLVEEAKAEVVLEESIEHEKEILEENEEILVENDKAKGILEEEKVEEEIDKEASVGETPVITPEVTPVKVLPVKSTKKKSPQKEAPTKKNPKNNMVIKIAAEKEKREETVMLEVTHGPQKEKEPKPAKNKGGEKMEARKKKAEHIAL